MQFLAKIKDYMSPARAKPVIPEPEQSSVDESIAKKRKVEPASPTPRVILSVRRKGAPNPDAVVPEEHPAQNVLHPNVATEPVSEPELFPAQTPKRTHKRHSGVASSRSSRQQKWQSSAKAGREGALQARRASAAPASPDTPTHAQEVVVPPFLFGDDAVKPFLDAPLSLQSPGFSRTRPKWLAMGSRPSGATASPAAAAAAPEPVEETPLAESLTQLNLRAELAEAAKALREQQQEQQEREAEERAREQQLKDEIERARQAAAAERARTEELVQALAASRAREQQLENETARKQEALERERAELAVVSARLEEARRKLEAQAQTAQPAAAAAPAAETASPAQAGRPFRTAGSPASASDTKDPLRSPRPKIVLDAAKTAEVNARVEQRHAEIRNKEQQTQADALEFDRQQRAIAPAIRRRTRGLSLAQLVLEFNPRARLPARPDAETLRKAMKTAMARYHPDRVANGTISERVESAEIFAVLKDAYESLS